MIGADRRILRSGYRRFILPWWRDILWNIPRRYVVHKWQRLTRGYSDMDMWNADGFLADLISATAYWHFAHSHGFGGLYVERYGWEQGRQRWLEDLLEIYEGFRRGDDDADRHPPDMAWDLLREMFPSLWD
jgi:hypothetical protein